MVGSVFKFNFIEFTLLPIGKQKVSFAKNNNNNNVKNENGTDTNPTETHQVEFKPGLSIGCDYKCETGFQNSNKN